MASNKLPYPARIALVRLFVLVLATSLAHGAIGNVQVRGVTATQAILSYLAPDATPCSIEVSESPTYSPLVHDVDTVLFSSANLDSRAESVSSGRQRVFVVGKRRAEKALDGHWYSRALQAFTSHSYRITCGAVTATGQFRTTNIVLGSSYQEALPGDPAVGSNPAYAATGTYAWPEFLNWDRTDPTARPEVIIDPRTGMLLKRLALPQDDPITYSPGGGDHAFEKVLNQSGNWTVPAGSVVGNTGSPATFSAATSDFLALRDNTFFPGHGTDILDPNINVPTEWIVLTVTGWCSGACGGEDSKIQACITVNGVTCWPSNSTAKFQEVALANSTNSNLVNVGTTGTVPILVSWTPAGFAPLTRNDLSRRVGMANVSSSGVVTWQSGGYPSTYFNVNWTPGTHITVGGSDCILTAANGLESVTVNLASCSPALTLPLTATTFSGSGFGFLIRKKTASLDRINLAYAKYTTGSSNSMGFTASGSDSFCSQTLTVNTVTGGMGYRCAIPGTDFPMLYWIDHITGDANFLGDFGLMGVAGTDGFGGGYCDGSQTINGTIPTAAENYYCSATDNSGNKVIVQCTLTSNNQSGHSSTCVNLTPVSTGAGIQSLTAAFTATDAVPFDRTKYPCNVVGRQANKLVLHCARGNQNSLSWVVVFDPFLVSTAAGCVGGGAAGCVVAAMPTWAYAPARWCTLHTQFLSGKTSTLWVATDGFFGGGMDQGPYVSTITSAAMVATPSIAAGSGICPPGSAGCNQVTVDGEPCNHSPAAGEAAGASVCPTNPAWAYLQNAVVGDIFQVENEQMKIVAKVGNLWTLQRGFGLTSIAAHNSMTLNVLCTAQDFTVPAVNLSYTWDTLTDPHGTNSGGSSVLVAWDYGHPTPRVNITVGAMPYYDLGCSRIGNGCYAVRDGVGSIGDPPNQRVAANAPFAGTIGVSQYNGRVNSHPSRLQENAPPSESKWLLDGRPLAAFIDTSDAAMAVSGQLYRLTSTTADGDNLSRVGYNVYVVKSSATTLVAGGYCSAANPCPNWDSGGNLIDSITQPCTLTVTGGSGTIWVSDLSGAFNVYASSGLSVSGNTCTVSVGSGFGSGTNLWSWIATSGTWAAFGTDTRSGASGYISNMNRKIQPTWAYCGTQPLTDMSSAATGNVISDTASSAYQYCVARKAGECRIGSNQGDIYANCPNASPRYGGSFGCMRYPENQDVAVDICVGNTGANLNSISQFGWGRNDYDGSLSRSLTAGMSRYKLTDGYWHAKALPDASWAMFRSMYTNGAWTEILLGKIPPYPSTDSATRSNFESIPLRLNPPAGLAVDNAVVQFGYAENGLPGSFYCTTRHEKCLASTGSVPTPPFAAANPVAAFSFPSDGAGGLETGVPGMPCASGCTLAIPAIPQRMLYYQVKYRDGSNHTIATGQMEIVPVA